MIYLNMQIQVRGRRRYAMRITFPLSAATANICIYTNANCQVHLQAAVIAVSIFIEGKTVFFKISNTKQACQKSCYSEDLIQSNFNASNIFGTMKICSS